MNLMHRLIRDESGATAIEYGLIVALIAIAITVALQGVGTGLSGTMKTARDGMVIS